MISYIIMGVVSGIAGYVVIGFVEARLRKYSRSKEEFRAENCEENHAECKEYEPLGLKSCDAEFMQKIAYMPCFISEVVSSENIDEGQFSRESNYCLIFHKRKDSGRNLMEIPVNEDLGSYFIASNCEPPNVIMWGLKESEARNLLNNYACIAPLCTDEFTGCIVRPEGCSDNEPEDLVMATLIPRVSNEKEALCPSKTGIIIALISRDYIISAAMGSNVVVNTADNNVIMLLTGYLLRFGYYKIITRRGLYLYRGLELNKMTEELIRCAENRKCSAISKRGK